ncbi:hypothetical protein Taro_055995 [Colocasia esculenta]|uniref:Uncharacterized protein n=1 Tax=Colocasia esculenta TaxID=4460 RepID=A0A843XUH7_COLES|nr:hypothetical protein [Colocasia esculenta]
MFFLLKGEQRGAMILQSSQGLPLHPHHLLREEFYLHLECTDEGYKSKVKGIAIDMPTDIAATIFKIPDEGADYHNFEFNLHEAYSILTGLQADETDLKQTHVTKFNTNTFPPVLRLTHHILTTIITPQGGGRDRLTDIQRFVIFYMSKNIKINLHVIMYQIISKTTRADLHRSLPYAAHLTQVFKHFGVSLENEKSEKIPKSNIYCFKHVQKFMGFRIVGDQVRRGPAVVEAPVVQEEQPPVQEEQPPVQEEQPPRLENTVSAKFIEQKAASDHATQRFNRLIGTLGDVSIELKEYQKELEIVLKGILANSQADVFNTKETLSQISKTRLSFAHLVDDLESMKNLSAHIDEEMSALKREFKVWNRPGWSTGSSSSQPVSNEFSALQASIVDTTINGVDTMVQNKGRNVKKSSSSVDTSPGQVNTKSDSVDTRLPSQKACFAVWDSRSTLHHLRSTLETSPRELIYQSGTVCRHTSRAGRHTPESL